MWIQFPLAFKGKEEEEGQNILLLTKDYVHLPSNGGKKGTPAGTPPPIGLHSIVMDLGSIPSHMKL